jgi:malic enzyme
MDAFVAGVKQVFPACLVQWEDFQGDIAFHVLERYRDVVPSFNDDIQGTAAVVFAGLLAALRITRVPLTEQRIVYVGAGAAGVGIGRLIAAAINEVSHDPAYAAQAQVFLDSQGLLHEGRPIAHSHKRQFALSQETLAKYGFTDRETFGLLEVVAKVKPTALIGTTAQAGIFSEAVLREMSRHVERPIIFALSNPTSKSECTPEEAIRWTDGRAIIATGSAFEPVRYGSKLHVIGQANNVYVFPGVGLGCILSQTPVVPDAVFHAAARRLAKLVSEDRLEVGAVYPHQSELRSVSAAIAAAVIGELNRKAVTDDSWHNITLDSVRSQMWEPAYEQL